jgi:DNA sulfur modification protein DndE
MELIMKFKTACHLIAVLVLSITLACQSPKQVTIHVIGDSTMANKPIEDNPERGWGQLFQPNFKDNVTVANYAKNGRSSKSFIDEGLWQTVLDSLKAGDFVIIQFGHNDEKSHDSTRYTHPYTTYSGNLTKFINETKARNASPVLCTPVMRRRFDENGQFYDTHGDYPDAVRKLAKELSVPLLDMHVKTEKMIVDHGVEGSKKIFLFIEPGDYKGRPDGVKDNTHFSEYGAITVAGLAAECLHEIKHPLAKRLK